MIKSMAQAAGMLLVCMGISGSAFAADRQIVFVDLDKAFTDFYKTKLADAQLKDQADAFNEERKNMVSSFEALQEKFNKVREETANTALSNEVREQKRSEAEEMLSALQEEEDKIRRFDESRRKKLQEQGQRMRKKIVDEIHALVQKQAKAKAYQAVIDISGQSLNGVPIVLYVDPQSDITGEILEILNRGK